MGLTARVFTLALAVCYVSLGVVAGSGWSYSDDWTESYPVCAGSSQSPIDIVEDSAVYSSSLGAFTFSAGNSHALNMVNNGHTVQVDVTGSGPDLPSISGGGLGATYVLLQFNFHWGTSNSEGSEHKIDGQAAPLEMHVVLRRSDLTVAEALEDPTGLAVLGVMFKISATANPKLDKIIQKLSEVTEPDETVSLDLFSLSDLQPSDLTDYYRYNGSLTTPPCSEAVVWTIFDEPVDVSSGQMDEFRALQGGEPGHLHSMSGNFRAVQALNGRVVSTSDD